MKKVSRSHPLWFAYCLHRASGLALVIFLPVHFWVLSLALNRQAQLDSLLRFTDHPLVKCAEFGLVFLLAVHCFGGLRLLALEWLPWSSQQKTFAAIAVAGAFLVSTLFLLQAL